MKRLLLLLLLLEIAGHLRAQCSNNNSYRETFTVSSEGSRASNSQIYAGEYVSVPVVDGGEYEFSVSSPQGISPQITLYDGWGYIGSSSSSIRLNSNFTGTVNFLLNDRDCSVDMGYAALEVRCIHLPPPPPNNDDCSSAQTLYPNEFCSHTNGTTEGATADAFSSCTGNADDNVWFRFTAINTVMRVKLSSFGLFDPVMSISTSCWGGNITCINSSLISTTLTNLTMGQTYYIQVYDWGAGQSNTGDFSICVIGTPPPSNDDCATAHDLLPNDGGRSGSTMGATSSGIANCTDFPDDDVWYSFTANNPNMRIEISGEDFSPAMELFEGASCGGPSIDCNAGGYWNMSGLTVGMTYKLRVYDRRSGPENTSPFWISLHGWPPPANDEWTGALTVWHEADTVPQFVFGNLQGATASNPVQNTVCGTTAPNQQDVWYKFVANSDLVKVIFRSPNGVQLQIFTDSAAAHINCVTANTNQILYGLTEGQTYYIRAVADWGGIDGDTFSFSLGYPESPSYDDCQGAIELTQNADQTTWHWASARGTSQSFAATPNCVGTADDDIWFSFVAQSSSVAVEMISSGDYDGVMQIYSHDGCGRYHLDCINDLNGSGIESRMLTNLTIGHRYKIRVYSHSSARPRSHYVGVHVLNPDAVAVQALTQTTLRVWPNPSEGVFNLDIDSDGETQVLLFDALGRQIYTTQIADNQINIQHLPAGVYVAKFMHGHKQYSARLVKID